MNRNENKYAHFPRCRPKLSRVRSRVSGFKLYTRPSATMGKNLDFYLVACLNAINNIPFLAFDVCCGVKKAYKTGKYYVK